MKTVLLMACAYLALGGAAMAADVMGDNELDATTAAMRLNGCRKHSSGFDCGFSKGQSYVFVGVNTEENSVRSGLQSPKGDISFNAQKSCNGSCMVSGQIGLLPQGKQPYYISFGPQDPG